MRDSQSVMTVMTAPGAGWGRSWSGRRRRGCCPARPPAGAATYAPAVKPCKVKDRDVRGSLPGCAGGAGHDLGADDERDRLERRPPAGEQVTVDGRRPAGERPGKRGRVGEHRHQHERDRVAGQRVAVGRGHLGGDGDDPGRQRRGRRHLDGEQRCRTPWRLAAAAGRSARRPRPGPGTPRPGAGRSGSPCRRGGRRAGRWAARLAWRNGATCAPTCGPRSLAERASTGSGARSGWVLSIRTTAAS